MTACAVWLFRTQVTSVQRSRWRTTRSCTLAARHSSGDHAQPQTSKLHQLHQLHWITVSSYISQCSVHHPSVAVKSCKIQLFTPLRVGGPPTPQAFFGQLKHIYKKSGKNIVFFSVFTMCSVENTVIYVVFGIKSVQNSGCCSVFKALASKNHSKYRYLQCFFISVRFSLAGSRPKWPKIPFQYPLKLRHPKLVEKTRKPQTPPIRGLGAKSFLPPPPAKADIATAILTNVIKHLV